jgi:hypothetical protein
MSRGAQILAARLSLWLHFFYGSASISGSSVWNLVDVTCLVPRIWGGFWILGAVVHPWGRPCRERKEQHFTCVFYFRVVDQGHYSWSPKIIFVIYWNLRKSLPFFHSFFYERYVLLWNPEPPQNALLCHQYLNSWNNDVTDRRERKKPNLMMEHIWVLFISC